MANLEYTNEKLQRDLGQALEKKEFILHYQPKLNLATGQMTGVEALIRWEHPACGIISPLQFIPLAEQTDLIIPIGEWVLRTACEQSVKWQREGLPPLIMAVNLSARQLYQPNFVKMVQQVLSETGMSPLNLELEITESMMMDVKHVLPVLLDLKKIGVRISLDDFGTGYSSLFFLKEFPIDIIKIDRSFVRNCTTDIKDSTIIKAIIAMAHQLKIDVIAEGIEKKEQLIFLQQHLCNRGQGYFFCKPLPPKELAPKIRDIEEIIIQEGIPREITRQKWLEKSLDEEALRKSVEQYRLIAENMTDLICVIDWDGYFKYASPSHVTVLGFPSEAYEGNRARDWMHKDDFLNVRAKLEEMVMTKERRVFEFRFRDTEGNWIWLEGKGTPIFNEEGEFLHFLVVSREITERKMFEEKLRHMAYHDTLTGLPNRRLFNERLEQALKEADRYGRKMAIMYMDVDKFKQINDSFGHDSGDALLKQFAQRVKSCLRESDTLSRHGGDEFIILLPEVKEEKEVLNLANRILAVLQDPWHIGDHCFLTTSSIGIACYPKNGITRHELLKNADRALYEAKEDGRNNAKMFI